MADDFSGNFVNPAYASPDQIAAQRQYAKYLTENQMPVTGGRGGWAIGLANALSAGMGGYEAGQADKMQRQAQGGATDQMTGLIRMLQGGGANPAQPQQMGDNSQPRGIRNNNPGNIEDGPFAKSQAGYAGSDGRFAQFATPEHGQTAASNLLANYGSKGVNTVAGIVNKWAPPSDNNPTPAYAAAVAKQLGVDPNQPLPMNDPNVRQQLASAMFQFENGKPVQMASLGNGVPAPQGAPNSAPGPQGGPQNAQGQPPAPQVAQASPQGPQGLDPRAAAQVLTNPWMPAAASKLVGEAITPQYGGLGVYDYAGHEKKGFINPFTRTAQPLQTAGTQAAEAPPEYDDTGHDVKFLGNMDSTTQAAVKAVTEGRAPATGRNLQALIPLAARYEQDFDQNKYNERKKFMTELGSANPNSAGGQKNLIGTSLGHLSQLAERAADLGNSSGFGLAPLGAGINSARNLTTSQAAKVNGLNETADRFAGEVGKLYSGTSGGGVQERESTRGRFGGTKTPAELAAGLEAGRDLIASKMDALQNQADTIFGKNNKFDFVGDHGRTAIEKINKAIGVLRRPPGQEGQQAQGEQPPAQPQIIPWVRRKDGSLGPAQ